MYVSMLHLYVPKHHLDEASRLWRESVLLELQAQPGWKDASFAISHAAEEIRVFTLWESEAQARAFTPCRDFVELTKLVALSSQQGKRAVYRVGETPEFFETLKPFVSKN